jgi:hypothetical protein
VSTKVPAGSLHFFERHPARRWRIWLPYFLGANALDGCCKSAANQAVPPVVVDLMLTLPLVYHPTLIGDLVPSLRSDVVRKASVGVWRFTE